MKSIAARFCSIAIVSLWLATVGCHSEQNESSTIARQEIPEEIHQRRQPAVTFVEYVPTPNDVVDRMLALAKVTADDVLYDPGCGDGRILVTAAKTYGCRAKGCDLDPLRVEESRENAVRNGVVDLVSVTLKELGEMDLRGATIVTLYLSPQVNASLLPRLKKLKPGVRIVSHNFPIPGVRPEKKARMVSREDKNVHVIYLYRCPLEEVSPTG